MPLFRFHKGMLSDSLKTTIIVKNIEELRDALISSWSGWLDDPKSIKSNFQNFKIKIEPYMGDMDERIGWYTQIVTSDMLKKDSFCVEGFLSEPMENNQ